MMAHRLWVMGNQGDVKRVDMLVDMTRKAVQLLVADLFDGL